MTTLAYEDPLTGLPNRRHLYQFLESEAVAGGGAHTALSLVLIDIDGLRQINTEGGHAAGDAVLGRLANEISSAVAAAVPSGAHSFVARYAGDEFVIVLPGVDKAEALDIATSVRSRVSGDDEDEPLHLSLGVATYPGDARSVQDLIESCDNAVYAAKRDGGDRITDASVIEGEVDSLAVTHGGFPCADLVGRDDQRQIVERVLEALESGNSSMALITGEAGTGKSRLLSTVCDEARDRKIVYLQVSCRPFDRSRPYATLSGALDDLLRTGELDRGALFKNVAPEVMKVLARVIPGLSDSDADSAASEFARFSPETRTSVFQGLVQALTNLSHDHRIALVFDDAHWLDEGSLNIAATLLSRRGSFAAVFLGFRESEIMGEDSGEDTSALAGLGTHTPLRTFFENPAQGAPDPLHIELPALGVQDITRMVRIIFPKIKVPDAFIETMHERAEGTPLYVEAALKTLLGLGRITLVSKRWVLSESFTPEDLPEGLAAALQGELATAEDDVREVLTNASALGPEFDVAMLSKVTGRSEEEIWGDLDRAEQRKLIKRKAGWNDDHFEFTARALQETSISSTSEDERALLHEKVAAALEEQRAQLKNQAVVSQMIARLAFHYGRAGNLGRAAPYQEQTAAESALLYSNTEAPTYARPKRQRIQAADSRLDDAKMERMDDVLRYFTAVAKNVQLYPRGSRLIERALLDLRRALETIFDQVNTFTIAANEETLLINGVPAMKSRRGAAYELWKVLRDHYVNSVTMTKDVTDDELAVFLSEVVAVDKERFHPEFWDNIFDQHGVENLAVDQRVYIVAGSDTGTLPMPPSYAPASSPGSGTISPSPMQDIVATKLDQILQSDKPFLLSDELKQELPGMLDEYLKNNQKNEVEQITGKLLTNLSSTSPDVRRQAAGFLCESLRDTTAFSRIELSEKVQDSLITSLSREDDAETYDKLASMMHDSARDFVKAGAYDEARRIVYTLRKRQAENSGSLRIKQASIDEMKKLLHSEFLDLLIADLQSGSGERQVNASKILVEFGDLGVEALIDILKEGEDKRTHRMTAEVLSAIGDSAYEQIKLELSLEQLDEVEFQHIIEVIDAFVDDKRDVFPELERGITHPARRVRQAAYRLGRRLDAQRFQSLLRRALHHDVVGVAKDAINSIGRMRILDASSEILEILHTTEFDELRKECCLTLGKLQAQDALKVLDAIVSKKKVFSSSAAHPMEVRAVAAWALSQIPGKDAERALARAKKDPEIKNWLRYRVDDD